MKRMIFWNVDNLATSLINGKLSEREKVRYYIALIYFQLIATAIPTYFFGSQIDGLGLIPYLICAVIATTSINSISDTNRKIDGENIIERLAILGFPAFIKATVIYWFLYIVFSVIFWVTNNMNIFLLFSYLGIPLYYWLGFDFIKKSLIKKIA